MRLATLPGPDRPHLVAQRDDHFIDLQASEGRLPGSLRELLDWGTEGLSLAADALQRADAVRVKANPEKLLPPVLDPRKIICLGLNYRDHAAETNAVIPRDPILFSKYATALIGHGEAIVLPPVSQEVDYEAELVVVVGKKGRNITEGDALSHVAGYMVGHDVSARDWQLKKDGKQWMVGKTFDTFAPTGPCLVTADEIPDPHSLRIQFRLNGQTMQDSNTKQMIFSVAQTLAYISQVCTLQPGDLIFTGTPSGVGVARKPPVYLKGGDVTEVEIEKLGVLRNPVVQGS
jgi:2-keto-4-pentenoate hydratase/2-oxohepta-3-ene-1,7-dioic acid hydratase in catechol pathway